MEEQAVSAPPAPSEDRRELIAPVAAWLAGLGFQLLCGPLPGGKMADLMAHWRAPNGDIFTIRVVAQATWAMCECEQLVGTFAYVCFAWTLVESEQEVRWLLERNRQYRQASAPAGTPLGAARGRGMPGA